MKSKEGILEVKNTEVGGGGRDLRKESIRLGNHRVKREDNCINHSEILHQSIGTIRFEDRQNGCVVTCVDGLKDVLAQKMVCDGV